MIVADEKQILTEIKKARERVHHWKQWRNEPSGKKKLGHWRRRLKKALKAAAEVGVEVPKDPFAPPPPPPPPPTAEEIAASEVVSLRKRIRCDFQIQKGSKGWTPYGKTGWSAIVVILPHYKWCEVKRVNAKTGEIVAKGKVRRTRILSRDPELKGKDKPTQPPTAVFDGMDDELSTSERETAVEAPTAHTPTTTTTPPGWKPPQQRTPEEEAEHAAKMEKLMSFLDDDSTTEDW